MKLVLILSMFIFSAHSLIAKTNERIREVWIYGSCGQNRMEKHIFFTVKGTSIFPFSKAKYNNEIFDGIVRDYVEFEKIDSTVRYTGIAKPPRFIDSLYSFRVIDRVDFMHYGKKIECFVVIISNPNEEYHRQSWYAVYAKGIGFLCFLEWYDLDYDDLPAWRFFKLSSKGNVFRTDSLKDLMRQLVEKRKYQLCIG